MTIDRRELIKRIAAMHAIATLPVLAACSRDDELPDGAPFSLWRRIRQALQQSPDHLAFRARDAVASGDLEKIFAFVRDNIAVRPWASPTHAAQIQLAGHAGIRGVLRSGIGTAREKTELLKSLLEQAGFTADIVDGNVDFEALGGTARFTDRPRPAFAPDAALAPLDRWLEQLDMTPVDGLRPATPDAATLDAMSARLLAAIPTSARGANTQWPALNDWLPLLRMTRDGKTVYANPNVPDARLGEHYCTNAPRPSALQTPVPTPALRLTLSMTRRGTPGTLEPILEGEWLVGDLVGRRVQLRFLPTQPIDDLLSMPLQQLRTVLPTFLVAGGDLDETQADAFGFSGDVLSVEGERITADSDGVMIDGRPLGLGNADAALAAQAQHIEATVNTSQFPRLRLEAAVLRADGTAIDGLPLDVFALQHGGRPMAARLIRNLPEAPRIAFALDLSTSLDEQYRGIRLAPVVERICHAVAAKRSGATFRCGAFTGTPQTNTVQYFSGWLDDASAVAESIRREAPTAPQTSTYFQALAGATNEDANLVVLITDADGSDSDQPAYAAQISAGCPAVIIGVRSALTREEHFARLAQLSGGHLFFADALDAATDRIVELADARATMPYVFDIVAEGFEDTEPEVRLSVPAGDCATTVAYERPDKEVLAARAISGLFLTIEIGNQRVVRRLAGFPLVSTALTPLTDQHVQAVRLAMLGNFDLSVEASAPTAAAALDDIVSSNLSCEAIVAAAATRDKDAIIAATLAGVDHLPERWLELNAPLPGAAAADRLSFQAGYRLVLFSDLPDVAGHYRRKVDILPFHDWRTMAPNEDAFAANLQHTLQLSMIEAGNFPSSTMSIVGDTDYVYKPSFQLGQWTSSLGDANERRNWQIAVAERGRYPSQQQLLLPADSSRLAYWEVDTDSGAVLGMLPDGSGGASVAETNRKFELLAQVIDAYSEVMEALIATPPAFNVWVELEKAKLEHLRRASIAIILMDGTYTSGYDDLLAEQVEGWITDQAQSAIDDALGGTIGGYSEFQEAMGWHDRAQQMWGAISGGGP